MNLSQALDNLTVGELEDAEELAGIPVDRMMDPDSRKIPVARAIATVMKRRTDPDFTTEQARAMSIDELGALMNVDGGEVEEGDGDADPPIRLASGG